MNNTNITYGTAIALSSILGKCTIKSLGSELFFPVIKLKANLSSAAKKYSELQQEITKECGVEPNADGTFTFLPSADADRPVEKPMDIMNRLNQASKDLRDDYSDIPVISLLSEKQFEQLFEENPELTTAELEILLELVA